jgi:hypothetical protein
LKQLRNGAAIDDQRDAMERGMEKRQSLAPLEITTTKIAATQQHSPQGKLRPIRSVGVTIISRRKQLRL